MLVVVGAAVLLVAAALFVAFGPAASNRGRATSAPSRNAAAPVAVVTAGSTGQVSSAARYFLDRYELPSGRVVRWDQGGDTVSEGEAYAMLLSVASNDRQRFNAAWSWTSAHLLLPSGLLAWHWAKGQVIGTEPAADADVDAAYALELGARRFGERSDLLAAATMASAIVTNESIATASGRVLVAGPWALGPPAYVNPSYASPAELAALGPLVTDPQDFTALAQGSRALVGQLLAAATLPPDWVQLSGTPPATTAPVAVAPPGQEANDEYGFDAVRLPIRWGASCDASDRHAAAILWPSLSRNTRGGRATVDLTLTGTRGPGAQESPVGLVAAAAAGWAAGHRGDALQLLARAQAANRSHPTYFASAWVALGRMFLETHQLGTCGAA